MWLKTNSLYIKNTNDVCLNLWSLLRIRSLMLERFIACFWWIRWMNSHYQLLLKFDPIDVQCDDKIKVFCDKERWKRTTRNKIVAFIPTKWETKWNIKYIYWYNPVHWILLYWPFGCHFHWFQFFHIYKCPFKL